MGTYDGPGLRLVVFLQGCPFKCLYCANPDTISIDGGKETDEAEILRMAVSQKAFFGRRGGITFSGGEPTLQAAQLLPLFSQLKQEGRVAAGMIPKLDNAFDALEHGVKEVVIKHAQNLLNSTGTTLNE